MILIGLSASLDKSGDKHWEGLQQSRVNQAYVDSVLGAGGLPLLIPVMDKKEALRTSNLFNYFASFGVDFYISIVIKFNFIEYSIFLSF